MENGRHRAFILKMLELDPSEIDEKLMEVFEKPNCAATINLALEFFLRNENRDECRYIYAHENNTFSEKSHLLCSKGGLSLT